MGGMDILNAAPDHDRSRPDTRKDAVYGRAGTGTRSSVMEYRRDLVREVSSPLTTDYLLPSFHCCSLIDFLCTVHAFFYKAETALVSCSGRMEKATKMLSPPTNCHNTIQYNTTQCKGEQSSIWEAVKRESRPDSGTI
jgi:hypothetical protein